VPIRNGVPDTLRLGLTGQLAQTILDGYITAAYSPDDVFSDLPEKEAAYVLVLP